MTRLFLTYFYFCLFSIGYSQVFNSKGTDYGEDTIKKYSTTEHWSHFSCFLIKKILPSLGDIKGEKILDGGCGPGIWIGPLASRGAIVYAIDIQEKMIEEAKVHLKKANFLNQINFQVADIAQLPYQDNFFDKILSINVLCNLPIDSIDNHFSEINRVLKKDGIAIIAIPTSLDIVFTDGTTTKEIVMKEIKKTLGQLTRYPKLSEIRAALSSLKNVLSATFTVNKDGYLILVLDKHQLLEGQEIWRKLPTITIPNRYYSLSLIQQAIKKAELSIEKTEYTKFASEEERISYNKSVSLKSQKLGHEYVENPVFCIYYLKRQISRN